MKTKTKILGISGSLRGASYNTATLKAAQELLPENAVLEITDISAIPFFNEDVEAQGEPQSVTDFKNKIIEADAILIATPEYNYSIPAVLKNALDWASRGDVKPLDGKPLAIMSASMSAFGGVRAQYHLRQICVVLNLKPLNRPEVFIMGAHNKFDSEGKLTDTSQLLSELVNEVNQQKA